HGMACRSATGHAAIARNIAGGTPMTVAQRLRAELARRGLDWIVPDWPAPANVGALVTTRSGEDAEASSELLRVVTGVQPFWLRQVHGASVAVGGIDPSGTPADAAIVRAGNIAAAVQTADCLPVLFCDH